MTEPFFPMPADEELPSNLQSLFKKAREKIGFVPNVFRAYAYRSDCFSTWLPIICPYMSRPTT